MLYNISLYNAHQYNSDLVPVFLTENVTLTDNTVSKEIGKDLNETILFLDADQEYVQGTLTDLVTLSDAYALLSAKSLADSIGLSEFLYAYLADKGLVETIILSEVLLFVQSITFSEFIFLNDTLRMDVTNKGLFDSIRLNDWLSIEKPFVEYWHD